MKPPISEFRSYLIEQVGENWVKKVSDKELYYFREWCALTGVYSIYKTKMSVKTGDAFRGFVMGLEFNRLD